MVCRDRLHHARVWSAKSSQKQWLMEPCEWRGGVEGVSIWEEAAGDDSPAAEGIWISAQHSRLAQLSWGGKVKCDVSLSCMALTALQGKRL